LFVFLFWQTIFTDDAVLSLLCKMSLKLRILLTIKYLLLTLTFTLKSTTEED